MENKIKIRLFDDEYNTSEPIELTNREVYTGLWMDEPVQMYYDADQDIVRVRAMKYIYREKPDASKHAGWYNDNVLPIHMELDRVYMNPVPENQEESWFSGLLDRIVNYFG